MKELVNMNDKRMSTAEVCHALGCDRTTLMRNWREIETCAINAQVGAKGAGATPFKEISRGRGNETFWSGVGLGDTHSL